MAPQALIVHKDRTAAEAGKQVLASRGYLCTIASGFDEASVLMDWLCPAFLLLERRPTAAELPSLEGRKPVVSVATFDTLDAAVDLRRTDGIKADAGQAVGHVKPPLQSPALNGAKLPPPPARLGMVGTSTALNFALALVLKAAPSEASILLCGESGTGKELAAKAIHANSRRAVHAFVAVDCAALPENLLEAELFGYEKGAFTGAMTAKPGLMEMADGGTLFLDEVGELPLGLQPKLLRALQEKEHRRLGGTRTIKFDVRVVAATNRDLHKLVKEGEFREDLLFRLSVIPIQLPPLRERHGDVPLLANWSLENCSERDTGMSKSFDPEVLSALDAYSWPGNVRELQNVVRRMCVLGEGYVISMRDLPAELSQVPDRSPHMLAESAAGIESCELGFGAAKIQYVSLFEASYLRSKLDRHAGNVSRAAEAADLDRKTFYRLLRKHHLEPERFRGHGAVATKAGS
jgi:transcriptional regulator with GAF, ATPase, and Fis domain